MAAIRAIALDVDGVLTDGGFWWGEGGEEFKKFSFLDVMGISLGTKAGLVFALISGEDSPLVDRFAKKMGIRHVHKGCKDKGQALKAFALATGIPLEAIAFMGDDVNDQAALAQAGLAVAPANAHPSIKACAHRVTHAKGGHGAVRELIDSLLPQD